MNVTIEWAKHLTPMNNSREHHFARAERVKKERSSVRLLLIANRVESRIHTELVAEWRQSREDLRSELRIVVTFVRIAPRKVDDGDNLSSCFKAIRDEIAAYLRLNDGDSERIRFEYAPQLKGTSAARVLFSIEPHTPTQRAVVTETSLATTPQEWRKRGLLSSGVVRNR